MAEQVIPTEEVPKPSIEQRLAALASRDNPIARGQAGAAAKAAKRESAAAEAAPVEPAPAAADEASTAPAATEPSELTPDDLIEPAPDDAEGARAAAAADEFEIVHNGTQHKLTRAETIELAQKGFDYQAKSEQLAASQKEAATLLQTARALASVEPMLMQERASITALEQQLKPWFNVDWVRLASEQPLEYPKYRAQFDTLQQSYQAAVGQYQQKANVVAQAKAQYDSGLLQQEMRKLADFHGMGTPEGYTKEVGRIKKYAQAEGYSEQEMQQILDARYVRTLWKAAMYDELVAGKRQRIGQLRQAPPVAKPGAPESPLAPAQRAYSADRKALKQSGSMADAARILSRLST